MVTNPSQNPLAGDLEYVLSHTMEMWEQLRGKKIFITGGTGFFGCWLLESFAWANSFLRLQSEATVLTRNPDRFGNKCPHLFVNPSIRYVQGDVTDFIFPEGKYDYIIHAATELSPAMITTQPLLVLDTIVAGSRRVLEFAEHAQSSKVLLISSGAVYGKQPADIERIQESYTGAPDLTNPSQVYGEGKRIAELLCAIYAKKIGFDAKIARCFAFVGPYLPLDAHFAIGNFIRDAIRGGPIGISGDGSSFRSYLYAADLAICLWNILCKGKSNSPYNVGGDESITIAQLAELVANSFEKPIEVHIRDKRRSDFPVERYVPSIKKMQSESVIGDLIPLSVAIKKTITWNQSRAPG